MSSVASTAEKQSGAVVGHNTTAKREIHSDPPQMKSAPPLNYAAQPTYSPEEAKEEETAVSGMADRFKITAEDCFQDLPCRIWVSSRHVNINMQF